MQDKAQRAEIGIMEMTDIVSVKRIETETGLAAWTETHYLEELSNPDSIHVVIREKGFIKGFLIARLITSESAIKNSDYDNESKKPIFPSAEIELLHIAVTGRDRGRGLGHRLLSYLLDLGARKFCQCIWLEVRRSNTKAVEFYLNHGFEPVYTRKNYYRAPCEDALVLRYNFNEINIPERLD